MISAHDRTPSLCIFLFGKKKEGKKEEKRKNKRVNLKCSSEICPFERTHTHTDALFMRLSHEKCHIFFGSDPDNQKQDDTP